MIEIKPAPRKNPEGKDDLPWSIFQDGRNTNDKPNRKEAELAVQRLLVKRGDTTARVADGAIKVAKKHFMQVPRPQNAPDIGEYIVVTMLGTELEFRGRAVEYLSVQFIMEDDEGKTRIFLINDKSSVEWRYANEAA